MEVASERLRALLTAAVARTSVVAGATASSKHAGEATQAGGGGDTSSAHAAASAFTAEDRMTWDAILADASSSSDPQQQSLADTIGLLLASTTVSDTKLVRLLRVLLSDASFDSPGVLLVVQTTVRGLKFAKRYNALELAARELPDAVFAKINAPATAALALSFWLELLLGYQHTAELFLQNHAKLAAVAVSISEQLRDLSDSNDISSSELDAMKTHLILACTALMHCHRGYEHECYVLQLALTQAFSADDVAAPTAASAETLLRESAWVLPIDQVSKFLPSVEGKWVVDEFANDAAGASSSAQNAGSVLLRTTRSCVAHELSASVVSRTGTQTLRLNGLLFQELPEMQELLASPDAVLTAPWELEGHWSQVFESSSAAPTRVSAPVVSAASTAWTCHACTMSNDASAIKCATCGTASPGQVTIQTAFDDVHGSNPAPFTATFDATYAFMRVQWSRGEQHGVWLAAKHAQARAFDLHTAIARASDSMTDATHLAMHAYSPHGVAANVLVLEKPIVSSGSSAELTLQLWFRPQRPCESDSVQVVLAYGSDFVVSLLPTGELVWDVADKSVSLRSAHPLRFDTFAHVTLTLSRSSLAMHIDSVISSECVRSDNDKLSRLFTTRASVFSLGGRVQSDSASVDSVFIGAICDLRIWSTVQPSVSATASLEGDEDSLVGYYPLVGTGPRLLLDVSKTENHATVFEAFAQTYDRRCTGDRNGAPVVVQSFAPTTVLERLPVQLHFPCTLGNAFIGNGPFSLVDGTSALVIDRSTDGAALWHVQPVSLASGFDTSFQVETTVSRPDAGTAAPSTSAVVFALCDATYWSVAPLIAEASSTLVSASSTSNLAGRGSSHTALFVSVEAVQHSSSNGALQYAIALFVRSKKHNYKLGAARAVAASGDAPAVRITYALPDKVLAVELGATGTVFECAIDLALALGIESVSSVRAGLVFPSTGAALGHAPSPLRLNAWQYEERPASPSDTTTASVLASVYTGVAALQPARVSGDAVADALMNTVVCTRCSSDGSAIEQECYGCQTCNLLHGSTVCRNCASVCHEGHELVAMGVMSAACACHTRGSGLCRCSTALNADDFPQLQHAIATPLWCCSKCTVINATALTECSICGNKAPRLATASTATASSASPAPLTVSTSRALALVETPPIEALIADWSCEACTMLNMADATKCMMCDTVRAKPSPVPATAKSEAKSSSSGMLALYNAATGSDNSAVAKPAAPTTWACSACTMENKSTDSVCYMCSTPNNVPIAAAVDASSPEVIMALPAPSADATLLPVPIDLTRGDSATAAAAASGQQRPSPLSVVIPTDVATAAVENLKFLRAYKQTVADATSQRDVVDALQDSHWETTAGFMTIALQQRTVAEYVDGTYADHDGYVRGLARITPDGVWKLDGTYKKLTQTHANAVVLQWDPSATRFDGKWFRGDGAGDWKCVLAPSRSLFRGWNTVEDSKDVTQPFYSGLVNMKQNLTNVCYQNSFLQTLFMTQAFRRLILSADLARYATTTRDNSNDILSCVQRLFAHMLASQRPALATHGLQRCLPATFQAGRQQDTSDFAHYVIDSLSEQLSQQPDTLTGVSDIFGGVQATVLACKTCGHTSVNKEYFWELLLNMIDLRYTPITGITAVSGSSMDIATPSDYERLNTDVNKDRNGAPYVFLCVKRSPERSSATAAAAMDVDDPSLMPITDLVVKVAPFHDVRPTLAGYDRVELDLNVGGSTSVVGGKKQVYLFTRREPNGSPITDLQVIYGNESVPDGFKQIRVDLNQGDGMKVFLCYRCDMPITDLKIVNSGIPGYKMVDHLLNMSHDDPVKQYLAYQVGGNEPCLTDLELVDGADVAQYQAAGWTSIGSPTSVVSDPTASSDGATTLSPVVPAQLMIRRGHGNPIFAVDVFRAPRHVPKYNDYEVIDVYPRDTSSDVASRLRGDWMASDDVDRSRKAVRIHAVSDPLPQALVLKGAFDDKGEIAAIATVTSTWSQSVAASSGVTGAPVYRVTGHWKSSKVKQPQLFDVELRPDAISRMYSLSGTIGDGKGRPVTLQGAQTSHAIKVKWPIAELFVLRGDEKVPDGVKVVRETVSGRSGNLLAQTASPHSLYLAVKREEAPASGAFVTDVCVIYGEIDVVPDGFTCIETTPGGFSANLNDGTPGVPIFICYRKTEISSADGSAASSAKVLMDVLPMWTSGPQVDSVPAEFTKIAHTPLGMDANVNQGTVGVSIHLCVAKSDVAHVVKPVESPLNGEFEITSSAPSGFGRFLSLSAMQNVSSARVVDGKFGTILHGHLPGSFRATVFETSSTQHRLLGVWSLESPTHPTTMSDFMVANYPFELTLNDATDELNGWWSGTDESATTTAPGPVNVSSSASSNPSAGSGAWKLMKDSYVRVGFKKDYGTEWKDGRLIASERVWRHDIASMLSRFVATRTLGGDNALSCAQCDRKTESRTHTVIVTPPAHLILTVKRMFYDWTQQKTRKSLHDVEFPALLTLPSLSDDDEAVVADDSTNSTATQTQRSRRYGLYGVLIHSGMTANSGHYYSFCRESDDAAQQLHLEDSPASPWIKFNDTKVERSSWKEINRLVANSVSDAVYLLLYKRLSYDVPVDSTTSLHVDDASESPSTNTDDEEAMLLAKAMALSMSAAGRKRDSIDETGDGNDDESKRDNDDDDTSIADHSSTTLASSAPPHPRIQTSILKEVERENATYLHDALSATSSRLFADDLHTLLLLRHAVPLHLRTLLDQVTVHDDA